MKFRAVDRRMEGENVLRQCQLVELYLLDVFVELCEKYSLRYYLEGGTMLGAMRHDGFIPWDDDIDVVMPYPDYKKFFKVAVKELPQHISTECHKLCGAFVGMGKLRDNRTFFCEKSTSLPNPAGIYIDIFPMCRFPKLPEFVTRILISGSHLGWFNALKERTRPHTGVVDLAISALRALFWSLVCMSLKVTAWILRIVLPCPFWNNLPGTFWKIYDGITDEQMFPLGRHVFEYGEYAMPAIPEEILRQHYGDWREMPPPEKRVWHSSIICPAQAPDAPWAMPYGKD